ncbi:MAG: helix-turn-helix domain-containing protein, partial [Tissierellaceae bacterium]
MDNIEYSEKEIAIFDGLVLLMREGANPYSIKVSDIARSANIGKGTIYDYFDSKEEVISKAIIYSMSKEIKGAFERIRSRDQFKDRFYEVLYIIEENLKNKLSLLNILLSSGGIEKFYEYLADKECSVTRFMALINGEIRNLLEMGFNEGLIKSQGADYYEIMVV